MPDGLAHDLSANGFSADIAGDQQAFSAGSLHQPGRFAGVAVLVQISDGDIRSFAGKSHGDRPPDAAVPAGDDRHASGQLPAAAIIVANRLRGGSHFALEARLAALMLWWAQGPLGLGFGNHAVGLVI